MGVGAKAEESFGDTIWKYREKKTPLSRVPERIDLLCQSIFGRPMDEGLGPLRYQLLHGVGGTLIEAKKRKAEQALLVVHEFISDKVGLNNVKRNAADFERFARTFPDLKSADVDRGVLMGPIRVPGGRFVPGDIPLCIGKVRADF